MLATQTKRQGVIQMAKLVTRRGFHNARHAREFFARLTVTKKITVEADGIVVVRWAPDQLECLDSTPDGLPSWCAEFKAGTRYDIVSEGPYGWAVNDDHGRKADIDRMTMRETRMPLDVSPEFKVVKGVLS